MSHEVQYPWQRATTVCMDSSIIEQVSLNCRMYMVILVLLTSSFTEHRRDLKETLPSDREMFTSNTLKVTLLHAGLVFCYHYHYHIVYL